MRRPIDKVSYFEGLGQGLVTAPAEWEFTSARDIKTASNEFNTTALEELNMTCIYKNAALTAAFATSYMQQMVEPASQATKGCVVWHYDMSVSGVVGDVGVIIAPYICQLEDADADTQKWQLLNHTASPNQLAAATYNMRATGQVIREKNGISGAEDTNNIIFGILIWNTTAGNVKLDLLISMNIYPITKPIRMIDPGI